MATVFEQVGPSSRLTIETTPAIARTVTYLPAN